MQSKVRQTIRLGLVPSRLISLIAPDVHHTARGHRPRPVPALVAPSLPYVGSSSRSPSGRMYTFCSSRTLRSARPAARLASPPLSTHGPLTWPQRARRNSIPLCTHRMPVLVPVLVPVLQSRWQRPRLCRSPHDPCMTPVLSCRPVPGPPVWPLS